METSLGGLLLRLFATGLTSGLLGDFVYGALFRGPYLGFTDRLFTAEMWGILWPVISGGLEVRRASAWPIVLLMWAAFTVDAEVTAPSLDPGMDGT